MHHTPAAKGPGQGWPHRSCIQVGAEEGAVRVAGVAMRLPGPWGGFWGTWKAGRAAGTHRHCRDERATARGAGGQQCSINAPACAWLDTGAGPAGQTGLWERGLHPPGARRQEFLSLHVSPGAASQARGRWPGSESAAAVTRETGPTCSPTHTPPTAPASANRRCLGWRGMVLMFPLTPEGETYGPLRNTCSRSDPGSSPGISAIFKTRVGAPWPQTEVSSLWPHRPPSQGIRTPSCQCRKPSSSAPPPHYREQNNSTLSGCKLCPSVPHP